MYVGKVALSVDALRAKIRAIEGAPVGVHLVPSGVGAVDELLGGLAAPGLVEFSGLAGSGKSSLALSVVAHFTADLAQWVAWIDAGHQLYPPAACALGVDLTKLVVVRPQAKRAGWAAEQVVRSGCFSLVVISGVGVPPRAGIRLARAAERGRCSALMLSQISQRGFPAHQRVHVAEGLLHLVRDRVGHGKVRTVSAPILPTGIDPWR